MTDAAPVSVRETEKKDTQCEIKTGVSFRGIQGGDTIGSVSDSGKHAGVKSKLLREEET